MEKVYRIIEVKKPNCQPHYEVEWSYKHPFWIRVWQSFPYTDKFGSTSQAEYSTQENAKTAIYYKMTDKPKIIRKVVETI